MLKTTFEISKMDCPSEESLIRMKLNEISGIKNLEFDISNRKLFVFHNGQLELIEESILALNLGGKRLETENSNEAIVEDHQMQRKLLWIVLIINFAFFVIEMTTGFFSKSMGLVADSLDMLADAFVYGISLLAVGGSLVRKKNIAKLIGYFQIILAVTGFLEVIRRLIGAEQIPEFSTMIIVSVLALIANSFSLYLLQKSKSKDAHMKASMICTSNDVIINAGVIVAGLLVLWFNSNIPDLVIGTIVFAIVIQGATRILKLGK